MHNKFTNLLEEAKILQKQLGHLSPFALILNKELAQTSTDFQSSQRTGQCASFIYNPSVAISAHHLPEGATDQKLRYVRNGQNKLIFLLENEERISTAPINLAEKEKLGSESIYRGGIKLPGYPIITTSGYHPVIDEAFSLNLGLVYQGFEIEEARETWIKAYSYQFGNPYAFALSSLAHYVSTDYQKALDWGLKEIGEDSF